MHWKARAVTDRAVLCCCTLRTTALAVQTLLLWTSWAFSVLTHTLHPPVGTHSPHKGGHWLSVMTRGEQHSDHRSGLPSCHQPGATSMRRKVRQDLASGITGAEQRMQDRRLAGLGLLRGEKGFNGCTPLPEGNSGDKQDTLFPTKGQHRADTGSKMGNSNQTWGKKPLWWDCLSTGTGCSERLWKYHSYRYILKYVPFNWTSSQWPHLPLTTTFVQGGRHQRSL